jgi:hypothetical protein
MGRGSAYPQKEHQTRCRRENFGALLEAVSRRLETIYARATGMSFPVDRALLGALLSEEDRRAGPSALCERFSSFASRYGERVRAIHRDYLHDPRRPAILDDGCTLVILEGLERDRFNMRYRWSRVGQEAELRQLAAIWGRPIS